MERWQQPWRLTLDQVLEALDTPPEKGLSEADVPAVLAGIDLCIACVDR